VEAEVDQSPEVEGAWPGSLIGPGEPAIDDDHQH
jgi:hypothetical protein